MSDGSHGYVYMDNTRKSFCKLDGINGSAFIRSEGEAGGCNDIGDCPCLKGNFLVDIYGGEAVHIDNILKLEIVKKNNDEWWVAAYPNEKHRFIILARTLTRENAMASLRNLLNAIDRRCRPALILTNQKEVVE